MQKILRQKFTAHDQPSINNKKVHSREIQFPTLNSFICQIFVSRLGRYKNQSLIQNRNALKLVSRIKNSLQQIRLNSKLIKIKLINSYTSNMDTEEPSPINVLSTNQNTDQKNTCQLIGLGMSYLLSPSQQDCQKGKNILLLFKNCSISELLQKTILSIKFTSNCQDQRLHLQFLRGKLHLYSDKDIVPNLTLFLETLITQAPQELRSLAVQCMNIYLNKPQSETFREEYLSNLIQKVEQQLSQNVLSDSLSELVTQIFSRPIKTKNKFIIRPYPSHKKQFSNNMQIRIQNILKQCQNQNQQVMSKKRVRFMLALCKYTDLTPSAQFVCRNLINKDEDLDIQEILGLTQMFNKMTDFKDFSQLIAILKAQLGIFKEKQFMEKLKNPTYETSLVTIIESIKKVTVVIVKAQQKKQILSASAQETQFYNKAKNQNVHNTMIDLLILLPQLNTTDKIQIFPVIDSIIVVLTRQTGSHELICLLIRRLVQKLEQRGMRQQLYQFMGHLSPKILKYFSYTQLIQLGLNQMRNNTCKISAIYLKMVAFCLKNLHETGSQQRTLSVVDNLIKYCNQPGHSFGPDVKTLVFIVMCQYLPKTAKHSQASQMVQPSIDYEANFKCLLNIGFSLLKQLISVSENDQVSVEDVLEGMWHACVYQNNYHELVFNYFKQFTNRDKNLKTVRLHLKLLQLFSLDLHKNSIKIDTFFHLTQLLFQTDQITVCQQCCSLILQVLIQVNKQENINKFFLAQKTNQFIVKIILSTKLLQYIESNLMKKNDLPLFSKILMELTIHKEASHLIKQMLLRVVDEIYTTKNIKEDIQYNFDRVWQALVILYGEENNYVKMKGICNRVDKIRMGPIIFMMDVMEIKDQGFINIHTFNGYMRNCWSSLPVVRRVIEVGSVVGQCIDGKLCKQLQ